jgi:hypothetical protein
MHTIDTRSEIRKRFVAVDSSNVADVLDERGIPNQGLHPSLRPESGERLAGWAHTIAGEMATYEGGVDPLKMQACGGIGPQRNFGLVWQRLRHLLLRRAHCARHGRTRIRGSTR